MLDFYADWCTSCKEMQRYTFTDPGVRDALKSVRLLRADVTANSADDQALLHEFQIYGPPTIAIYDALGHEHQEYRVVGYMKAAGVRRAAAPGAGEPADAAAFAAFDRTLMPPASRILVMVLVALAGVLAGFLSYRTARAPAAIVALAAAAAPRAGDRGSASAGGCRTAAGRRQPGPPRPDRFRTRYRT